MSDPQTDPSAATAFDDPWHSNGWPAAVPSSAGLSGEPSIVSGQQTNSEPTAAAADQERERPGDVVAGEAAGLQVGTAALDEPLDDEQPSPLSEADAAEILEEWDGTMTAASGAAVQDAIDEGDQASGEASAVVDPYDDDWVHDHVEGAGLADGAADEFDSGIDFAATEAASAAAETADGEPVLAADESVAAEAAVPAEADWFPSADAPPAVPLYFVGFCLGCGYNLRGLGAARCPECGRIFRPTDPTSYSATPGSGPGKAQPRPKPWPRPTPAATAPTFPWSAGTTVDRVAWLERRVRQLAVRNGELEGMVRALIDVMAARGMLTAADLFEIVPAEPAMDADESAAGVAEALMQVTDDTPLNAEADVETAALRELQRAVRQRRRR